MNLEEIDRRKDKDRLKKRSNNFEKKESREKNETNLKRNIWRKEKIVCFLLDIF